MKHLFFTITFCFWIFSLCIFSHNQLENNHIVDNELIVVQDTVNINTQLTDEEITKVYQEILEKTNAQLNLWWNPYGVMIGSLGVLFAILTIISAVIIYRQGKDYKEIIHDSVKRHQSVLDDMIREREKQFKILEANYAKSILELEEKSKVLNDNNDIKPIIELLQKQKESLDTQLKSTIVTPKIDTLTMAPGGGFLKHHTCSNCGYGYYVNDSPAVGSLRAFGSTIECPKCKNVEKKYL